MPNTVYIPKAATSQRRTVATLTKT